MNIVEPILFHCRSQAPVAAMCAPGAALPLISYARLERFIHNIARNARSKRLERGNIVALFIEDHILHAAFILGLSSLGVVTLSGRSADLPKELKIDAVVSDVPRSFKFAGPIILAGMDWTEGDGRPLQQSFGEHKSEDLCRMILTSGTTGDPKAVAFTHDMVLKRIHRHNTVFGSRVPDCSRTITDIGLATSLGFFFVIYTLSRGGTVFFRGPDAVETMQALDLYQVQGMVASPAALAEFVDLYEQAPSFPPRLDVIVTGGSLLSGLLSERVRARLCTNLITAYGATETSMVAAAPAHTITHIPGAVGYVTPGVTVEIVDHAGNLLPTGMEGSIRIRSEFGVDGYVGDPAESLLAFRDGAFYPGDIGRLTDDRLLIISGREKAVLNLGGDKVNPERVEQALMSFPGITQAGAFSILNPTGIEELCVAVVCGLLDETALRAHCERHLPSEFVPLHFLVVNNIPISEMGKIDRRRLADLLKKA